MFAESKIMIARPTNFYKPVLPLLAFLVTASLVFWGIIATPYHGTRNTYLLIFIAIWLMIIVFLFAQVQVLKKRYENDIVWLHPPVLVTIWIILWIVLPGLFGFIDPTLLGSFRGFITYGFGYSLRGFLLIWLGSLVLWLGYMLGMSIFTPPNFTQKLAKFEPKPAPFMFVYALLVVLQVMTIQITGIAFGANRSNFGILAPFTQWFTYFSQLYMLVLAVAALQFFRKKWSAIPLIVVFGIQTVFAFTSGFMKPMLWLGMVVLVAAIACHVSKTTLIRYIVVFLILSVLVVPVAEGIRFLGQHTNIRSLNVATDLATTAFENSWGQGVSVGQEQFADKLLARQTGLVHIPGIIMARTPTLIPYQGFEQFLAIPAYIVPRALWPGKPVLSRGKWFNIQYFGAPEDTNTSLAMTIFGEGYIYAGWAGAMFASFCYGFLLALLYRVTVSAGLPYIFLALLPSFIDIEGQFSSLVIGLLQLTPIMMLIYWTITNILTSQKLQSNRFMRRKRRRTLQWENPHRKAS